MTIIDSRRMTPAQKEYFAAGWVDAGGYLGDVDAERPLEAACPCPLCSPWTYGERVEVVDGNYYEAGAKYWERLKGELDPSAGPYLVPASLYFSRMAAEDAHPL